MSIFFIYQENGNSNYMLLNSRLNRPSISVLYGSAIISLYDLFPDFYSEPLAHAISGADEILMSSNTVVT